MTNSDYALKRENIYIKLVLHTYTVIKSDWMDTNNTEQAVLKLTIILLIPIN